MPTTHEHLPGDALGSIAKADRTIELRRCVGCRMSIVRDEGSEGRWRTPADYAVRRGHTAPQSLI